jgi:predicted acetyltransferase
MGWSGGVTNHLDNPIELAAASLSDARLIESLLDDYLRELSEHRDVPVGATDSARYPYLDAYWSEPGRHAFLIKRSGDIVGFALVRDPASTGSAIHQLAEFYIKPESRRSGIGHHAVLAIWEKFPGEWELQVHAQNSSAVRLGASSPRSELQRRAVLGVVRRAGGKRACRSPGGASGRRATLAAELPCRASGRWLMAPGQPASSTRRRA